MVATIRPGGGTEAGVRRRAETAADKEAEGVVRRAAEEAEEGVLRCEGIGDMM